MYKLLLILALILSISCDPPRRRQGRYGNSFSNFSDDDGLSRDGDGQAPVIIINQGPDDSGDSSGGGATSNEDMIPAELRHCSFAFDGQNGFMWQSNDLGKYTLCQSSQNRNDIYLQVQNTISQGQLCLIPIGVSGSTSTFIGEPRCLFVNDSLQVYKIDMRINRIGLEGATMAGVMLIKDITLPFPYPFNRYLLNVDAYLYCMNQVETVGDDRYCSAFNTVGKFTEHRFSF